MAKVIKKKKISARDELEQLNKDVNFIIENTY